MPTAWEEVREPENNPVPSTLTHSQAHRSSLPNNNTAALLGGLPTSSQLLQWPLQKSLIWSLVFAVLKHINRTTQESATVQNKNSLGNRQIEEQMVEITNSEMVPGNLPLLIGGVGEKLWRPSPLTLVSQQKTLLSFRGFMTQGLTQRLNVSNLPM